MITINWDNEAKTTILICYSSPWTWKEHYDCIPKLFDMMASVNHPVDLIYDFRHGSALPSNTLLHFMRGITQPRPLRTNRIVVVGVTGLLITIGRILRRIRPDDTYDIVEAKSIEEARKMLGKDNDNFPEVA